MYQEKEFCWSYFSKTLRLWPYFYMCNAVHFGIVSTHIAAVVMTGKELTRVPRPIPMVARDINSNHSMSLKQK